MAGRLEGRVAIVTGGGTGIGAAVARLFAAEGAEVTLCGRRRGPLEAVVRAIAAQGGRGRAVPADVADEAEVEALLAETQSRSGRLDVLVNNAYQLALGSLEGLSTEDWHRSFRVTLDAAFFGTRAALRWMRPRRSGAIVNVSSTAGLAGQAGLGGYACAKAALENLTRTAAVEAAAYGVRVNSVCPGVIATEGTLAAFSDAQRRTAMTRQIPLGRFGLPEEVARAALFLASEDAGYVTGATLLVDGGQRACLGAPTFDEAWSAA
ncbi:MAG TPA: SDR family NAD(P)-dependent oxidoreductase [Myxococcota bacterium]|nr:SDR family NAD(P)-dependent oxidoreductase [Myxococcota bacterium]